jgi:hypothetical protein
MDRRRPDRWHQFSGSTTSLTSWTLDPSYAVRLVDGDGAPLSTPSVPGDNGFNVSYGG